MRVARNDYSKKVFFIFLLCFFFISSNILPICANAEVTALKVGEIYNGFLLKEDRNVKEINSKIKIFSHSKSGANLVYVENDDENMTFDINFVTPTSNNTGVNHILEHSVLYGSDKYPVKSPLMEISKHSVVSFVNAITSSDRTQYPITTNNYKDFKNVMGIYMDAVFFPKFRNDERIFRTQAGHYELASKNAELTYNGVVYNEMKAALSNPDRKAYMQMLNALYPNTTYGFESGGKPEDMPSLSYKEALQVYNTNYHPSNSYIFIYGKLDILDVLRTLNTDYLSKFDKKTVDERIPMPKSLNNRVESIGEYPIAKNADCKNKTYLSLSYAMDLNGNKDDTIGLTVLSQILLGLDSSPLKKALIQNGFGSTVVGGFSNGTKKPFFYVQVNGSNKEYKESFAKFVDDYFVKLSKEGLDKEAVRALLSTIEFETRKDKTNNDKGQEYNQSIISSWIYENDPFKNLDSDGCLAKIKNSLDSGYFENLIKKYFIGNNHSVLVVLSGKPGLQQELDAKMKKQLSDYKATLSDKELDKLVEDTKAFKEWQNTPDNEKALATIPKLKLSDINTASEKTPIEVKDFNTNKVLSHEMYTNKVSYMNYYFDTKTVPQDKIYYISILSNILGRLDTKNYTQEQLEKKCLNTGNVNFGMIIPQDNKNLGVYNPKFVVTCGSTIENSKAAIDLANEIMTNTKFDSKDKLKAYISEMKTRRASYLNNSQINVVLGKLMSYINNYGQYNNLFNEQYYKFLNDLEKDFDAKYEDLVKNLNSVRKLIFNGENLVTSFAADKDDMSTVEDTVKDMLGKLPNEKLTRYEYKFDSTVKNEGFTLPGLGQYVAKGCDINKLGYKFNGKMLVLQKILTNEYLMPTVREKGGAYGSQCYVNEQGIFAFVSWRDPNLKSTLEAYNKAGDFLRNFKISQEQLTSYILGLVNADNNSNVLSKINGSDFNYMSNISAEDAKRIKEEILSTTPEDIAKFAYLMDAIAKDNTYCVIGSADKINESKDIFTRTVDLLDTNK